MNRAYLRLLFAVLCVALMQRPAQSQIWRAIRGAIDAASEATQNGAVRGGYRATRAAGRVAKSQDDQTQTDDPLDPLATYDAELTEKGITATRLRTTYEDTLSPELVIIVPMLVLFAYLLLTDKQHRHNNRKP